MSYLLSLHFSFYFLLFFVICMSKCTGSFRMNLLLPILFSMSTGVYKCSGWAWQTELALVSPARNANVCFLFSFIIYPNFFFFLKNGVEQDAAPFFCGILLQFRTLPDKFCYCFGRELSLFLIRILGTVFLNITGTAFRIILDYIYPFHA